MEQGNLKRDKHGRNFSGFRHPFWRRAVRIISKCCEKKIEKKINNNDLPLSVVTKTSLWSPFTLSKFLFRSVVYSPHTAQKLLRTWPCDRQCEKITLPKGEKRQGVDEAPVFGKSPEEIGAAIFYDSAGGREETGAWMQAFLPSLEDWRAGFFC